LLAYEDVQELASSRRSQRQQRGDGKKRLVESLVERVVSNVSSSVYWHSFLEE
jgi:hypothetical protein